MPQYTPSILQQTILSNQILTETPTKLHYVKRSVFMKEVNTQNLWTFELGTQEGMTTPIWIIIGFQQKDRQDSQNINNIKFYRPPVTSAQCIIGTAKYPDSAILLNYDDDQYIKRYGQILEAFKALTKYIILQPYISYHDFRSSIDGNNLGFIIYAFDIRYQRKITISQPIKVEFKFSEKVPAGIYG